MDSNKLLNPKTTWQGLKWFFKSFRPGVITSNWARGIFDQVPYDKEGEVVPWMTFGAIEFLKERLPKNAYVLEFGGGASTYWFRKNAKWTITIESSSDWLLRLPKDDKFGRVLHDPREMVPMLDTKFDIILIDGIERPGKLNQLMYLMKPETVVILDDSNRKEYQEGIHLFEANFKKCREIFFHGKTPCGWHDSRTSFFYVPGVNCLGI